MNNISYKDYYDIYFSFFWHGKYKLDIETEGTLLKATRGIYDLNQDDLSSKIGITKSFLSTMENGKRNISMLTKQKLALFILEDNVEREVEDYVELITEASVKMAAILDGNPWLGVHKNFIDMTIKKIQVTTPSNWESIGSKTLISKETFDSRKEDMTRLVYQMVDKALNESRGGHGSTGDPIAPKRKLLMQSLDLAIDDNQIYEEQLINVLHKSLGDISSFFEDIDIIRRYDLETVLDRIGRSIKKLLRDSYNEIHNDITIEGYVGAGNPYDYMELARDTVSIPNAKDINFGLIIRGDSMSPSYQDGDMVFVKKQEILENGQLGIFEIDGKYIFKKYYIDDFGNITLKSINRNYKDIILNKDMNVDFKIIGKVIMSQEGMK